MALKIRKDDMVKVISGKSKGRTGRVLRVDVKNQRVYVEGANIIKRHQRPTTLRDTQRGSQVGGGVIEKEGPIHISNVMLLDPKSGDPTRVRVSREGGQRKRIAARSGETID
jgi:large subunit ribosomal protein L24